MKGKESIQLSDILINLIGGVALRIIKEGDIVDVYFNDRVIIFATVISTPMSTGDLWYLDTGQGIIAVNPNCSDFRYFEKAQIKKGE